ncbi:Y-family DNA polymerase [Flavobacterium sp. CYK-4]|uniref:Y-family DNA polymerase n=1 Tax=Flavobacterium lotistagni TaxID=2709660 RepID=UPI00140DA8FD|nr:Y-family DNA polymerase [Flavobacterium lotistagni]NHM06620.1 Y-family DNA polymerase [Flavobacterium lotistagni]
MYALVDCNNFYASCERLFQPGLVGKPIAVLSNNDGCIISRSDEAKVLGIPMGAPEFQVREQLRQSKVHVFSSNYALYGDLSQRVFDILRQFTPNVEEYSIDEAFLNFDGLDENLDYHDYGLQMRNRILKWLSIPVCVGVAPTKALSKVANKIARKFPKQTSGVHVIDTDKKRIKALKWTKIEDVWGIGFRLSKKMKDRNIYTAYDFVDPRHRAWIKLQMGVVGLRLVNELEGQSVLELEAPLTEKKTIAVTRSFPKALNDFDALRERVSTFASVCAEKLRAQKSCCQTVYVFLKTVDYPDGKRKSRGYQQLMTLPFATQSTLTLVQTAVHLLTEIYRRNPDLIFAKAGVIVSQLCPENEKQFDLFADENPKHLKLMQAMDHLNQKIGERKVKIGTQGEKTWNMKQEKLSPKYTTRFDEILTITCR